MNARTENLLMTVARISAACSEGHFIHTCWYEQFDFHEDGLTVSLPTGISADLGIVAQYESISKACFDLVSIILTLRRSSE